jgi:DNA (cytosine-5)-methyltransferase 1
MRDVLRDLAALGFDAEWSDISAWEVGAPHIRRRIFIVATDAERVQLREQPGWLCRAFESARAPIPRHIVEALQLADAAGERREDAGPETDESEDGHGAAWRTGQKPGATDPDGLRRLEQSWRLSTERGWPIHRGWRFDSTPRVDDVPARGLVGAMRKAAGNAVVTACAFVVGAATRRAVSFAPIARSA